MKPTKYDWKLLEKMKEGEEVSLPLEHRNNAARAIQRLRVSNPAMIFTTQKLDEAVFKIKRLR